jgi:putative nucleotidyltransferase with HDIG domain
MVMEKREFNIPQPVLYILRTLQINKFEADIVGGAVRDTLMGRSCHDWDVTTNATPEALQPLFAGSFYDNAFGTVMVPAEALFNQMKRSGWQTKAAELEFTNQVFDITTYRTEHGYSDRRRPDKVEWGQNLSQDVSRRDFTINAMAMRIVVEMLANMLVFAKQQSETKLEVEVLDYYGGLADIGNRIIRTVGEPEARFREDALRMMRAIRFGAQLGFLIEKRTLEAIQKHSHLIANISWERIRDELLKTLVSDYPGDGVPLLVTAGLMEHIMPEILAMRGVVQGGHHIYDVYTHSLKSLQECPSSDPIVRLAVLLHDVGKPKTVRYQGPRGVTFYGHELVGARMAKDIGQRLRLARKQIDKLFILVRWHMFAYDSNMTDAAIRRFIARVGLDNINDMLLLRVGDRKGGGSKATSWRLRELQERIGEQLYEPLGLKDLVVDGSDVMEVLGMKPGPKVGSILKQLFEEVMDDSGKNNREYLLARIREVGSMASA